MKEKMRNYQNKNEKQDVLNFEIANELGAEIEKNKNMHEKEYSKNMQKQSQNTVKNKNNSSNNHR